MYCRGSGLELLSAFLSFNSLNIFLKQHASSVRDAINIRHKKKFDNMRKDYNEDTNIDRSNWVINLSKKPLTNAERSLLEKGPKFAIEHVPQHKNINNEESQALRNLKKDATRIIMKADKGNSLVVLDRSDYDSKMENLFKISPPTLLYANHLSRKSSES